MAELWAGTTFCQPKLSVLKLLKYILNIIVWTLLGLYLLFILTFQLPATQEFAGRQIASLLAEKLGTDVKIKKAEYRIPSYLSLNDVLIKDQQGKDMLKVRHIAAKVELIPLLEGRISIASAQLFSAHARLYQQDSISKPNFQFVLDSLASKDTTSTTPLNLRINSLIVRQTSVSFDRHDLPQTIGTLNPNHLKVSDISAHVILKALTDDSLNVNVKRLTFMEQSGLKMNRLSFKFIGGQHSSKLSGFKLQMPGTDFQLGDCQATYIMRDGKLVTPSLYYSGSIEPSHITLSDLACFLPSLKSFNSTLTISSSIEGKGEKLAVPNLSISSTTGDIDVNIDGWVDELTAREPKWQANINNLNLSAKTLDFISQNLKGERAELPEVVSRIGNMHLMGIAKGEGTGYFDIHSQLNADIGKVGLNFEMNKQRAFKGYINTQGINLQKLLADDKFGLLATDINIEGRLPADGSPVVNAKGQVQRFEYNKYLFNNIDINGSYSASLITGLLTIDDPNLGLQIEGSVDRENNTNIVNLKAGLDHFSPQAIHLSDQWGEARFDANIVANFKAKSLNDAVGTIDMTGLTMTAPNDDYQLDTLHIESGYEEEIHFVRLNSDFGDVDITGDFDYETLTQSFTNFIATNLPTLPGLPKVNPNSRNSFVINAHINKSDWLQKLLMVPVTLQDTLILEGMIDDPTRNVALEIQIPHFTYNESRYQKGHLSISAPSDSIRYDLRIAKLNEDNMPIDLHLFGKAANNNLHTSLAWDNHQQEEVMKGQLNIVSNFTTSLDNKQIANIHILPSVINVHNSDWIVDPAYITYSKKYVHVKNFTIRHGQQHIIVNGVASESPLDSLNADLVDVDIAYILQLVNFDAVDFNGYASGPVSLRAVFGDLQADARLGVREFEFQHGRMGMLYAEAKWNKKEKQIDIHAIADDGEKAKTYVDGYVSPERNYIDLGIRADGTYLDFAQSFTKSFISKIDGHGSGAVRLIGPLDAINLTGELVLNGTAHVKTLGCTYELRNDTLRMKPNEIEFVNCSIYDIYGNEGMLTGGIHHKELTHLTYDINVNTQKMLVYDFPDFGDETFYGTVYANGQATIHGGDSEVRIEADVTPLKNSVFVYNASTPDVITDQEFIQWGTKGELYDTIQSVVPMSRNNEFRSDLTMRLRINATPDATIRLLMDMHTGDYITLRGSGDIHATYYNKGGFNMFGTYEVSNGTYNITIQDIIKKNFIFQEGGTIVFSGDPYDAQIDMQAQHIVNGVSLSDLNIGRSFSSTVRVNCLMNITGQPRAPILDFDLDILNVNSDEKQIVRSIINGQEEMRQQVIYLLAVGRFYPQGANNANESETQRNNTSLAMQSLLSGTLSGQLNTMLSQVIKSNNWNFGANISTGDEGWNNAEYEGLISGRLLNNRLLINGQFGYRDSKTTATPSFIGDFDIRYLLFPSGNLAVKVYNQTNDRYFTRSSLNTQGIGLIMKKDFNGLRDLFNIKKKKKAKEPEESKEYQEAKEPEENKENQKAKQPEESEH